MQTNSYNNKNICESKRLQRHRKRHKSGQNTEYNLKFFFKPHFTNLFASLQKKDINL